MDRNIMCCAARLILSMVVIGGSWGGTRASTPAQQQPLNVLFLLTDDQRPDTIAALGNRRIHTPHLDRLVREGVAFTRAVSVFPLCTPVRASILSGSAGFRNTVLLPRGDTLDESGPLWPQVMKQAGYRTAYVGKWHNSGRPSTRGYEEVSGLYAGGGRAHPPTFPTDYAGREVTGYLTAVFQTDEGRIFPEKGVGLTPDISAKLADAAIEQIRRPSERPFFLHVNFTAPHDPLLIPPAYAGVYPPDSMPLPANFRSLHPFDHGNFWGRDERLLPWPRTPDDVRADLAAYYAVISDLDEQIGRILKSLEDSGQLERTLIIFSSDHGLAMGSHGLRGKQNMYEHTVNVPLIFRSPGLPAGRRVDQQVYLHEIYPTVCEFLGIPISSRVEGRSFAPLLRDQPYRPHEYVFAFYYDTQRMVRTDRWKMIHYPQQTGPNQYQLFDLQHDPEELNNLAGDGGSEEVLTHLRQVLNEWQRTVNDPVLTAP